MRIAAFFLVAASLGSAKDSCVECHSVLEGVLAAPTARFKDDVHKRRGFSCADCHGGDRNLDDPKASMSSARGFRGKIQRTATAKLCASCHSDTAVIHRFKPQQRVDQYAQYLTSTHGKRMAAGDTNTANCTDCHSVHDIREVRDAQSPVHPLRLPETCSKCHSDAERMKKYSHPTTQFEEYRRSVHWEALAKRGDVSAPGCASCHGSHGATPPQVTSVAAVCGTCHVLFENLYDQSPHKPVFTAMGTAGCVACHGNHEVTKPSPAMLAGSESICGRCHETDSAGGKLAVEMGARIRSLEQALGGSDEVLNQARRAGMEVSEALVRQVEGRENLVKARVAVHAFELAAVEKPIKEGLAIAAETHRAGQAALKERDFRRTGLGLALIAILVTIIGLWLAIRSIERRPEPEASASGR